MGTLEQKPQSTVMREVPAGSPVVKEDHPKPHEPKTVTVTVRTHTAHLYTYPNSDDHYMNSDLNREIMENPSLGFADF